MRLLLHSDAHRTLDDDVLEIAASPDTPGREEWRWHVRLDRRPTPDAGDGPVLRVQTSPESVEAAVVTETLTEETVQQRSASEITVLVVLEGDALIEGRHRLAASEAFVIEGDDPVRMSIAPLGDAVEISTVTLRATDAPSLPWVP